MSLASTKVVVTTVEGGVTAPLGKSDDFEDAHAAIEPNGQDVADLHRVSRGLLADAIDADMTGLDQRSRAGAGFDHPRMPQPFVETLALQTL